MPYPQAVDAQVEFFQEHGWLVVADAIDPAELSELGERCEVILQKKHKLAFDWAWEKGKDKHERDFKIVQSSASMVWPEIAETRFRRWMVAFASALMQRDVEFWYDQYLAKPPRDGAPTYWHQDEGYWDPGFDYVALGCWMSLDPATVESGCMSFIPGSHRSEVRVHRHLGDDPAVHALVVDDVDVSAAVPAPVGAGGAVFHHCRILHSSGPNRSARVRRAYANEWQLEPAPRATPPSRPWIDDGKRAWEQRSR